MREQHGKDVTYHAGHPPDAVAFAAHHRGGGRRSCGSAPRHGVPVIAFGAGTSLEGHIAALEGGVSIDLGGMDRGARGQRRATSTAGSRPGVTRKRLNAHLRDTGLFFPIDPGADASLGGMAATRASGTNAVRYGTMRENVLGLTVVTADGRGHPHRRPGAQVGGGLRPDPALRRLRGHARHHHRGAAPALRHPGGDLGRGLPVRDLDGAVDTVIATIQSGIPVARIELLDEVQMRAVQPATRSSSYAGAPTLFFEFHGSEAGGRRAGASWWASSPRDFGGADFRWATRAEERNRLWQARHDAY